MFNKKSNKILKNPIVWILALFMFSRFANKSNPSTPEEVIIGPTPPKSDLTDKQALEIAHDSLQAMKGIGTYKDVLRDKLLPLSEPSFNHVVKVFGLKEYRNLLTENENLNMIQWLHMELSYDHAKPFFKFSLVKKYFEGKK